MWRSASPSETHRGDRSPHARALRLGSHPASASKRPAACSIAHEDCLSWGYGAEIAARIADELFAHLDAPVARVAALDTWIGYNPQLEEETLPQVNDLVRQAEKTLRY